MVEHDILNPHSEVELEKAIRLELIWLVGDEAERASLAILHDHLHKLKGLHADLAIEKYSNRSCRKNDKGVEIDNPLARSWHK
jgi:hypothetical protein